MNTATTAPAAPPLPDDLAAVLKRMRMPYLRAAAPEVLATARAQRWDPTEVMRVLLAEEVRGRDEATRAARRCRFRSKFELFVRAKSEHLAGLF